VRSERSAIHIKAALITVELLEINDVANIVAFVFTHDIVAESAIVELDILD
jgi:hypothetical protein